MKNEIGRYNCIQKVKMHWGKRIIVALYFLLYCSFLGCSNVIAMLGTATGNYEKLMGLNLTAVQSLRIGAMHLTTEQMSKILCKCSPDKLVKLTVSIGLGGCAGFQELPENMRDFKNLQELDLYGSGIKKIEKLPEWLGDFCLLQKLLLPCGPLPNGEIPLWIFKLRNLVELDVSGRCLKQISSLIGNFSNLQFLNLRGNYLEKLPSEIGRLTKLEELFLSCNFSLEDLPNEMALLKNLTLIDISETGMGRRRKIPECISHVPQIKIERGEKIISNYVKEIL